MDALTFTMHKNSEPGAWCRDLFRLHIEDEAQLGNDMKATKPQGFEGIRSGSVFYGQRDQFNMFEAKGGRADSIARELRAADIAPRCTRLDFQVTYQRPCDTSAYARRLHHAFSAITERPTGTTPEHTKAYQNSNGGNSYYLHTASADSLFRSYNKAAESPGEVAEDAWRAECQFRHQRAKRAWMELKNCADPTWLARSYNCSFMIQLGLSEEWMQDTAPCKAPSRATKTDTARRLEWFLHSALPVLPKLVAGGCDPDVLLTLCANALAGREDCRAKSVLKVRELDEDVYLEGLGKWPKLGVSKSAAA